MRTEKVSRERYEMRKQETEKAEGMGKEEKRKDG